MMTKKIIPLFFNGTKNIEIGKSLEVLKIGPRKENPLSKSIWLSGLHPETTNEEIDDYIVDDYKQIQKYEIGEKKNRTPPKRHSFRLKSMFHQMILMHLLSPKIASTNKSTRVYQNDFSETNAWSVFANNTIRSKVFEIVWTGTEADQNK